MRESSELRQGTVGFWQEVEQDERTLSATGLNVPAAAARTVPGDDLPVVTLRHLVYSGSHDQVLIQPGPGLRQRDLRLDPLNTS